jgi:hypothetical protein
MGSVIAKGPGSGRGGARPGAGRKKGQVVTYLPENRLPRAPKASEVRAERVQNFRSFARQYTLDNIEAVAREIQETGTKAERVEFLFWMARQGFGDAPKAHASETLTGDGQTPMDILNDIAARKTLEAAEAERSLKPALGPAPAPDGVIEAEAVKAA